MAEASALDSEGKVSVGFVLRGLEFLEIACGLQNLQLLLLDEGLDVLFLLQVAMCEFIARNPIVDVSVEVVEDFLDHLGRAALLLEVVSDFSF